MPTLHCNLPKSPLISSSSCRRRPCGSVGDIHSHSPPSRLATTRLYYRRDDAKHTPIMPRHDRHHNHRAPHESSTTISTSTIPETSHHAETDVIVGRDLYARVVSYGEAKAHLAPWRIFWLGILGGCYVSFGAWLALTVAGGMPGVAATDPGLQKFMYGAFGFPLGLTMVAVLGAELFTGNTAFTAAAALEGRASPRQVAKSWIFSFLGNFIGAVFIVSLIHAGDLLSPTLQHGWARDIAVSKVYAHSWFETLIRGVVCNYLVSAAMVLSTASSSLTGKFTGIFLANSAFAALGLEHVVANMFIISLAMSGGASITLHDFILRNVIPAAIGNAIGGAICIALAYALAYGKLGRSLEMNLLHNLDALANYIKSALVRSKEKERVASQPLSPIQTSRRSDRSSAWTLR